MSSKRNAVTPCAIKGTKHSHVASLLETEKEGLGGTRKLLDWYTNYFCPTVHCFYQQNELPAKAPLLLDNVPGHSANLAGVRTTIVYMPSNTTLLFQPKTRGNSNL